MSVSVEFFSSSFSFGKRLDKVLLLGLWKEVRVVREKVLGEVCDDMEGSRGTFFDEEEDFGRMDAEVVRRYLVEGS